MGIHEAHFSYNSGRGMKLQVISGKNAVKVIKNHHEP